MHTVATVCFLSREGENGREILLRKRKSRRWNGILNGCGGEIEDEDKGNLKACACRKTLEESGCLALTEDLLHIATVDFYHLTSGKPRSHSLRWKVHYFTTDKWQGDPRPLDGFENFDWFPVGDLPFEQMMSDTRYWLNHALNQKDLSPLYARVKYGDFKQKTVSEIYIGEESKQYI